MSGVWGASAAAVVPFVRVQTGVGATGAPEGSNEDMSEELSVRVERGAAWLDRTRPEWWRDIDLGTLNLADGCRCVLGQLDGDFLVSLSNMDRSITWAEQHGFTVGRARFTVLDELWISAVKARFEAGSL